MRRRVGRVSTQPIASVLTTQIERVGRVNREAGLADSQTSNRRVRNRDSRGDNSGTAYSSGLMGVFDRCTAILLQPYNSSSARNFSMITMFAREGKHKHHKEYGKKGRDG